MDTWIDRHSLCTWLTCMLLIHGVYAPLAVEPGLKIRWQMTYTLSEAGGGVSLRGGEALELMCHHVDKILNDGGDGDIDIHIHKGWLESSHHGEMMWGIDVVLQKLVISGLLGVEIWASKQSLIIGRSRVNDAFWDIIIKFKPKLGGWLVGLCLVL